jgi:exodeoxyribonuclease-5
MNCVNKSSKEFKSLAAKHNVSDNTLELIVHKYWKETGSEELFPSDSYIQAQLGAIPYEEPVIVARELWQKEYSGVSTYNTFDDLQKAMTEASKYFPAEAIVYYKNADGKYSLTIKKPVVKLSKALDDIQKKGYLEARKESIGTEDNKEYSVDKAKELFNKFNADRTSLPLADKMFKLADTIGIKVVFSNGLKDGNIGAFGHNTIILSKDFYENSNSNDKKAATILHELIHAITTYAISDKVNAESLSKPLQEFRKDIHQLFTELQYNPILKDERGVLNEREFIAELSNPIFRQKIQAIDNNRKESFWQRVVNAIKKLLGIHSSSPYYTRMMNTLDKAINAFDIKTYMEYNDLTKVIKDKQFNADYNVINNKEQQYGEDKWQKGLLAGGQILRDALREGLGAKQSRYEGNGREASQSSNVRKELYEESSKQQEALINWAKAHNYLIVEPTDYFNEVFGDSNLHGTESVVWKDSANNRVIKSIVLNHYATPQKLLERILVHNTSFPSTAIKLEGIGTSPNGISIIVSQPFIDDSGTIPTYEEIEKYMTETLGFQHNKGTSPNAEYTKDGYLISDVRPENVIKQSDGSLAVIDCFAMIKQESKDNDNIYYNALSTGDIKKEIHDYVDNLPEGAVKSKEALHSFINDLTESDIKNIYNEIEQNRNDVNLVVDKLRQLARDKKPKGNQKYFTFKDGKSVKAPFIPNDQQTEALDKIDDFLKSNKKVMTLSGYAGTGKTSIMEMIAEKAKIDGMQIVFTATTNKATQVLKAKVGYIGYPVMTANKAFGIALEPGDKQEYDADDLKAVLVESKVAGSDAAIIDEASMISQENFDILTSIAKETGLKIIFVGDVAQLPPVERDNDSVKLSPVFTNKQGDVITLTKVERTGDNAILKEATNLRDGEELSGVSSFNKDGKGVAYIKPSSQEERDKIIKTFAPKMREDPDYFRILTYSNKSVAQYNDTVRRLLGYNDNTPRVGETILGYANYDYNKQTRQYGFINSGSYKVVSVAPSKVKKIHIEGEIVSLDVVPVTIEGIDGGAHTYDMVDIKGNDANKKAVTKIAKTLSNLWAQWKSTPAISQKRIILEAINGLEKSLFVNDNIFNERGYKLLNKRYDFGYAMTIHKSQGSTFKNVLLDDVNIAIYNNYLDREALKNAESKVHHSVDASSIDTTNNGIAAAHSNMDNAEIESSTDFDLFGDDNTQGAASSQTNTTQDNTSDMVDIRRQLEYVGVSRASDTVTIISNDVKKEGSPLSPKDTPTEPDTTDTIKNYTIPNHYTGMITPDANTIFVFGSNPEGRHGAGAAKTAVEKFGAKYRQGEGLQGNAYALPTKDLNKASGTRWYRPGKKEETEVKEWYKNHDYSEVQNHPLNAERTMTPQQIIESIKKLYKVASQNPNKQFKVSHYPFGQLSLNGYLGEEMLAMFKQAGQIPSNVVFNKEWIDHWNEVASASSITSMNSKDRQIVNPVQKVLSDKKVDMQKTLSLPNFEHFVYNRAAKDLKGIEIDYPWKEPYLKELDSQFRRMEDEDDEVYHMSNEDKQYNQKLIDKMKVILNAKDKDDYLDEKQRKEKEEEQAAKSDFHRLNQQYANLLNGMTGEDLKYVSSPLKVSEIRDIAELTMDYISDTISDIQAKEGLAKQLFPNVKPKEGFDFTKATREEIIGTIGIENLLNHAKKVFDPEQNDWFDNVDDFIDATTKADFIRNNWDAIVKIGSDIFTFNEGIGISRDYGNHRFSTTKENLQLDINNFNDFNDEDSLNETEGDAQEHWQVDFRTIDAMMSMSAIVRKAIHECYKLDENGEPVVNPLFGIKERIDPRQVTNSILRWTQGSLTLEDMIQKLNEKKVDNPWLEQLINRLQDKSNPVNIDLQSQFFGVFSKHFQLYSIVLDQNGKFTCINANAHPALTEVMDSIAAKYNIGEHPLFQTSGLINRTALDTLHQAENNLPEWNFRGMKKEVDMSPDKMNEYAEWLSKVSSVLGFDATPDMVASVLNKDTLSTMVEKLHYLVENLDNVISKSEEYQKKYNPFEFKGSNAIKGEIQSFIKPITEILEDTAINAFYNSGKMYQSYVIPSFTTKLFQKFTKSTNEKFKEFMEEEYGKSQWFGKKEWSRQYGEIMHWNVPWLKYMGSYRSILDHRVQLSFNGHNYMKNLTDPEYALSVLSEYFSVETENGLTVAWFRIPMESNKPSEEFIKFRAYREDLYKKSIVDDLSDMVFMEISRIQTVMRRNLSKGDKGFIKNFDTNGRQFCFFPFLNDYIEKGGNRTILKDAEGNVSDDNEVLAELLQKKIKGEEELTSEDEIKLKDLIEKATTAYMQKRADNILEMMDRKGIIQAAQKVKNIIDPDFLSTKDDNGNELEGDALDEHNEFVNGKMKDAIENFIWNDYLASKNILMMLVGDTAFYKDAEDLQKRLAELHAPGIRANVHATDYGDPKKGIEPKRVSDGKYRTLILKDFDDFKSNIIANLTEVFDRKIAQAKPYEKAGMMALKENVIKAYSEINVADAEGYSCMTSYRKKALMFGKWGLNAEEIYKKILNRTYTYTDLKTAFQPMKPFVYTHLLKNMNAAKAPITQMYCPFQAKNSEVLLVMADALLKNEKTSRPNILRAISNIMEDSAYDGRERDLTTGKITKQGTYNGKGIDTVQFESAIKSSLQTPLDLNQFIDDKENGEARAYTWLKSHIYKEGTNDYDTDNYVQEAPFEDYAIQQEIPEHFKDHSQAHGSQIRMIIPSDLDYYYDAEKGREHPEDESNIVKYEWTDDKGNKHSLNADEFRHHYESTIAENILDSLDKLAREFHLQDFNGKPIEDKKERNMALSQILVKEIDSSPRYGVDLRWACSLNDDGEFNIPLGDPIQCKRIEQLINSIIKNRVNKQEIAGGPIVQVSNYGASKQLHIRFNDKNGNLMPSEEEFNKAKEEGTLTDDQKKYSSYQDYAKENQGGIAYFEVFAPIWSDEIAEKFMDKDGNIDMKAIEETNPEMLKLITYRIPTEDKYSMAPCKIVGFMPRQAGETIMLPYELTSIDGSDFDIDKRYVMRKDYRIIVSKKKVEKELYKRAEAFIAAKKNAALTYNDKTTLKNKISVFLDTIDRSDADKLLSGNLDKELKRLYQEILDDKEVMKHCYTTAEVSKNSKQFNDNEIVNMSWAVLTNPTSADKILNPGGFELQKKVGYMVAAYKNPANADVSWDKLHALETGDLKKLSYTQKDLAWFDTQMQFYKQNSAAATLIGIFAVNKIAHAVLEADEFYIDIDEICGTGFNIGKIGNKDGEYKGLNFAGRMKVDPRYDSKGNIIGKVLGSLVGASADAVKDPVLNLMNINITTAGMLNTMIRLGLPFEDAALFLSQDIVTRVIDEFNKRNLSGYASIDDVVNDFLDDIAAEEHINENSNINYEAISKQELIDGLREGDHKASDYKVLLAFSKLKAITDRMRNITFATRFNSISSAVGPLIVDNLIMEHKIGNFLSKENADLSYIVPVNVTKDGEPSSTGFYDKNGNIVDINDVWAAHPILDSFKSTVGMAYKIFNAANMPTNSPKFRTILATLDNYGLTEKVFSDKKLLDQLSTFYQSYMLMASELIDSENLSYYINEFPKKFLKYQQDPKYKDNALIQAIKLNFSRKTKKPFLQIKITGMDAKQKEELSSAWVDLYKENQNLSNALFQYSFFRAGIGFSPKTFMALIPVYVKNHLSKTVDSKKITYNDVYKGMYNDRIVNDNVIDQFVRNNWDNKKLVSWANVKEDGLSVNLRTKTLTVYTEDGYNSLMGKMFIKTFAYGNTYLWKKRNNIWSKKETWIYDMVSPLGNNGEYLEISTNEISKALADTKKVETKDNQADSDIRDHNAVDDEASSTHNPTTPDSVVKQNAASLKDTFINSNSRLADKDSISGKTRAENHIEAYKKPGATEKNVGILQKSFKANGLNLNEEETIKKFREKC